MTRHDVNESGNRDETIIPLLIRPEPQARERLRLRREPLRAHRGLDVLRWPLINTLLRNRWPQLIVRGVALAGFLIAIIAGLIGTPVGSHNFGIVGVWIAWWALLMLIAVPVFGRGWCSICPIPMPGEWLQNGAILGPQKGGLGLNRKWPKRFRNIWLQNLAFTLVALFSAVVLTQPSITAIVLSTFLFVAIGTSLIFERRAFCRYLCPVGGFIGLYSQLAPVEIRVKDTAVCAAHTAKSCYVGSAGGYGCPWLLFPGALTKNTYCGTCLECIRTCPYDNIAFNIRSFGADLHKPANRKLDEAFKALIMLGAAIVYSAVMLGPWGALKSAAYNIGSAAWLAYALTFLGFIFGALPGLYLLAVAIGRKLSKSTETLKKSFIAFAYALVPLGLMAWIAFSLSFVFSNISYLWPTLSDPLGQGWNLFGTANVSWQPYLTAIVPFLQTAVLIGGLVWASVTARRIAAEKQLGRGTMLQALPVIGFCFVITAGLMGLLIA
ncbi:MAG: 4Fe-4S binding protein [Gemmatimonadaceae bacterium]|nr:4Fe-4S binding protein [Gemmatimonadaceae bacterium]